MRFKLFSLFLISLMVFTWFSYKVAKEKFHQIDFDITVKLQDHISRKFDGYFSYFSLLASVEVTVGFCLILALLYLVKKRLLAALAWMMIIPASMGEVFGKLVLFHPSPPVLFHRSVLPTNLPTFYVHTDFSYPSGHMTRSIFILTIFFILILNSKKDLSIKTFLFGGIIFLAAIMAVTRIYLGEHWLSDVIGGSILGLGMGFFSSIFILKTPKG